MQRTLFAAVHIPRGPVFPEGAEADAYSLFHARSSALGHLVEGDRSAGGLWGMNDAGVDAGTGLGAVAWFHVAVAAAASPPPVQAFLSCVADVLERVGVGDVRAVEVLLPLHGVPADTGRRRESARLIQEAGWFSDVPSIRAATVSFALAAAGTARTAAFRAALHDWARRPRQPVVRWDASPGPATPPTFAPAVPTHLFTTAPGPAVTAGATIAEWSLDAIGWVAASAADELAAAGVNEPTLLTVVRA